MIIGTAVETEEGRTGRITGHAFIEGWDWKVAVKFDDGGEETVPEHELTAVAGPIEPKAMNFERDARRAGWSALARSAASDKSLAIVSARNDFTKSEIYLYFRNGRYDYTASYAIKGGRRVKVRNVSEAKRLLGTI